MAVRVETGEKLDRQNANGLQDYVGNLPNVSLQTFGSPGLAKVIIRGINSVTFNATTGTYIDDIRSEEHTSELQSLMRISYAVFCLKKKKKHTNSTYTTQTHN